MNTGIAVGGRIMSSRTEVSSPRSKKGASTVCALISRLFCFRFSDLGRHLEAIVRDGAPRQNGGIAPQEQIEAVTLIFSVYLMYEMHEMHLAQSRRCR